MTAKFKVGQIVRKIISKDQLGTVIDAPRFIQGVYWYKVRLYNLQTITVVEDALEPYISLPEPEIEFVNFSFSDNKSLARIITFNKLIGGYLNNPAAFKASKTLFKPHQYKPLLKFLYSDNQRLLIADEVGLGKTIEAGYILLELEAREKIKISFIICPKSLCVKWEREMREKFGMQYEIKSKEQVLRFLNEYDRGTIYNRFLAIVSYQMMRGRKIRDRLAEVNPDIDLVIMDEMHWARNETSQTNRLARQISELSNSALGLTATPIMLGSQNLYNLLNILNPFEFQSEQEFLSRLKENKYITSALRALGKSNYLEALEYLEGFSKGIYGQSISKSPIYKSVIQKLKNDDESREKTIKLLKDVTEMGLLSHVVTRTRRKEVELKSKRKAQTYTLEFTEFEKRFYNAVTSFIQEKYSLVNKDQRGNNFALMMPQRQVASCIPAMINYYLNNPEFLEKLKNELESSDLNYFDESVDNNEENYSNSLQIRNLIKDIMGETTVFVDSKYNEFIKVIKHILSDEPQVKILVFSYFKATLKYLSEKLNKDGLQNYLISGDINPEARQDIMDNFRSRNDRKILLSSEVGSEGLDLEFCSVVINYDLPWNPMVVEQRIGRADRFGQQSDIVTIVNFSVEDTIESRILDRLYERIKIFEEAIGDLESILGEEVQKLTIELLSQKLSPHEQEERIAEVANAIISKKIEAQTLEEESMGLITNDEYFQEELNSILQEKRYLTPEELFIYVNEFMKNKYPECMLKYNNEENVFEMYISEQLDFEIRNCLSRLNIDSPISIEFYRKISVYNRKLEVTFDSEIAFNKREIELINTFHPLIVFITNYFEHNKNEIYPTSAIKLTKVPYITKGIYFYSTFEYSIIGGRNYKALSHIIIDEHFNLVAGASEAAEIISSMILEGDRFDFEEFMGKYDMKSILNKMEEINLNRFNGIIAEIKELNESTILKQKDITTRIYNSRINQITKTISIVENDNVRKRIVPALQGKIKILETDLKRKLDEINRKDKIEKQTKILSAGILKIGE